MSISLMRKAIKLYSSPNNPRDLNRHLQRQWLRSVSFLGDKWVYAVPRTRQTTQDESRALR